MAGKHRAPTNTRRNIQRVATGGAASLALLGFTQPSPEEAAAVEAPVHAAAPPAPVLKLASLPVTRQAPPQKVAYTVAAGDTLSEIARDQAHVDWHQLYSENREVVGGNPNLIFPGQVLHSVHFVGGALLPAPPQQAGDAAPVAAPTVHAPIANSAGPVHQRTQAAADSVFANVPGAQLITFGGTRSSAIDPNGHPSGNAIDYMVMGDSRLGEAIVAYNVGHWAELGVEYVIWQQRIKTSANGGWQLMEDRGSPTQNHMDHVHVNYLP